MTVKKSNGEGFICTHCGTPQQKSIYKIQGQGVVVERFEASSLKTEDRFLDTDEAAAYLGVSPTALRILVSRGRVPYFKFARRNRYRLSDLRSLLLDQTRS